MSPSRSRTREICAGRTEIVWVVWRMKSRVDPVQSANACAICRVSSLASTGMGGIARGVGSSGVSPGAVGGNPVAHGIEGNLDGRREVLERAIGGPRIVLLENEPSERDGVRSSRAGGTHAHRVRVREAEMQHGNREDRVGVMRRRCVMRARRRTSTFQASDRLDGLENTTRTVVDVRARDLEVLGQRDDRLQPVEAQSRGGGVRDRDQRSEDRLVIGDGRG